MTVADFVAEMEIPTLYKFFVIICFLIVFYKHNVRDESVRNTILDVSFHFHLRIRQSQSVMFIKQLQSTSSLMYHRTLSTFL